MQPRYLLFVYRDNKKTWRWRLVHRNGRIIADSGEGYQSRGNAIRAARRLREIAGQAEINAQVANDAK